MIPYELQPHLVRFSKFFDSKDSCLPKELFAAQEAPDLNGLNVPLPSKKADYTCRARGENGVLWLGAKTGLTRYDPNAERKEDAVMFFSAQRDLPDNEVCALFAEGNNVWVKTAGGAVLIEMKKMTAEEKANLLLEETLKYVDRHGMVSQKSLAQPGEIESAVSYGHSDNDGCFTAGFAMGEMFHYAVLKKEKGENDEETKKIRAAATRAVEACLLLMFIHGRGNGFIARSYLTKDEPLPDDGLFYKKENGKAVCVETSASKRSGIAGKVIDASFPVPERLAALYRSEGYSDDDITYKGDTSSDEVTLHFLNIYFAHEILGEGDPELDELLKTAAKNTLNHIIDHGFELHECTGRPTTWAKWSEKYFEDGFGWGDAPLNAAEMLMYLRVVMHITGENGKWQEAFDYLISRGYADLTEKHWSRSSQAAMAAGMECREDLMFGDHMLATASFWGLIQLETDEELKEKYQNGFRSWRPTIAPEHNPGYDFPFLVTCPEEEIDMEAIASWFYRANPSRLASGVSLGVRHDVAVKPYPSGEYYETSWLLPQDERFISKYDRNPLEYKNEDSGGDKTVESCYVFTNAYWMGRYYGFIK